MWEYRYLLFYLPTSGSSLIRRMRDVEKGVAPIQVVKREESEIDALHDDIKAHMEQGDLNTHERNIEGHIYLPLPMIKGTYGKYY